MSGRVMLTTTKTPAGDWRVKGLPLVIARDPEPPRYRERAEWFVVHDDDPDGFLLRGFYSKADALVALQTLAGVFGWGPA